MIKNNYSKKSIIYFKKKTYVLTPQLSTLRCFTARFRLSNYCKIRRENMFDSLKTNRNISSTNTNI